MKYESVHNESYKGLDINIYKHASGFFIVDIKEPCGEFLMGWEFISDFDDGRVKALQFIDKLKAFAHLEHHVNYCINDDDFAF